MLAFCVWVWALGATALGGYRVAVLPFAGVGEATSLEGLGMGLQSMITTDLAAAGAVTIVERAQLTELLREQDLVEQGLVDPKQAVKLGRLVNASHVVTGSVAVVGDTMRLDARLAVVETGVVETGEQLQGPTEEFFDLEKQIVNRLLGWIGAELSARERHQVNAVQTYDFDNFVQFSKGLSLFSEDRLQESAQLLEQVARKEPTFTLARVTLTDIRNAIAAGTAKSEAIRIRDAQLGLLAQQEDAQIENANLAELRKRAQDPAVAFEDRVAAWLILMKLRSFRGATQHADRFLVDRLMEQAYQGMFQLVRPRVPELVPYAYSADGLPRADGRRDVDQGIAWTRKKAFNTGNSYHSLYACARVAPKLSDETLQALWVPFAQRVDLRRSLVTELRGCMQERDYHDAMREVAADYARLGKVGEAAAIYEVLIQSTEDQKLVDAALGGLKELERVQTIVDAHPADSFPYEALVTLGARASRVRDADDARSEAHRLRRNWRQHRAMYVGTSAQPVWLVEGRTHLTTGRRFAPDQTTELRYLRSRKPDDPVTEPFLAVTSGTPTTDRTLRVTLDYRFADDEVRVDGFSEGPATAGLLLGLTDVDTHMICDPKDNTKFQFVPLHSFAAWIKDGVLQIVELEEPPRPDVTRCGSYSWTLPPKTVRVLGQAKVKGTNRHVLEFSSKGTALVARVGRTTVKAKLEEEPRGFSGLVALGNGHVRFSEIRVR